MVYRVTIKQVDTLSVTYDDLSHAEVDNGTVRMVGSFGTIYFDLKPDSTVDIEEFDE